jgi:hypothetical protein
MSANLPEPLQILAKLNPRPNYCQEKLFHNAGPCAVEVLIMTRNEHALALAFLICAAVPF